mmetsp:Transcript_264/g.520  ORF Transcript_264/g.520 Transcript_264/m.520 type:complete len:120 (+) Transcript_264:3-362(+)
MVLWQTAPQAPHASTYGQAPYMAAASHVVPSAYGQQPLAAPLTVPQVEVQSSSAPIPTVVGVTAETLLSAMKVAGLVAQEVSGPSPVPQVEARPGVEEDEPPLKRPRIVIRTKPRVASS